MPPLILHDLVDQKDNPWYFYTSISITVGSKTSTVFFLKENRNSIDHIFWVVGAELDSNVPALVRTRDKLKLLPVTDGLLLTQSQQKDVSVGCCLLADRSQCFFSTQPPGPNEIPRVVFHGLVAFVQGQRGRTTQLRPCQPACLRLFVRRAAPLAGSCVSVTRIAPWASRSEPCLSRTPSPRTARPW